MSPQDLQNGTKGSGGARAWVSARSSSFWDLMMSPKRAIRMCQREPQVPSLGERVNSQLKKEELLLRSTGEGLSFHESERREQ